MKRIIYVIIGIFLFISSAIAWDSSSYILGIMSCDEYKKCEDCQPYKNEIEKLKNEIEFLKGRKSGNKE